MTNQISKIRVLYNGKGEGVVIAVFRESPIKPVFYVYSFARVIALSNKTPNWKTTYTPFAMTMYNSL